VRQAVVVIHGIGEQIPMETLRSFVDAVWTTDASLVDAGKPDSNSGGKRTANASWSKPDRRTRSFELRIVTTESGKNRRRTDFFEYYWAHRILDTTWQQLRAWFLELMLRNPVRDVPRGVLPVWILMWFVAAAALGVFLLTLLPDDVFALSWPVAAAVAGAAVLVTGAAGFLARYIGDVARYVKAKPANVARRQEIRENGVQLLETLMGIEPDGTLGPTSYDRIIVVGHSLGTIIAYDILTHAFARINALHNQSAANPCPQQARVELEQMLRVAAGLPVAPAPTPQPWSLDRFRAAQAEARTELNASGNPWIVSDFVTLGSPLTHAEFLMVRDRAHLSVAKTQRILPTCPPTLEYDRGTGLHHFTYRAPDLAALGKEDDPAAPRCPHHAALFAYTRWTNVYSPHRWIALGDLISGPLADAMGLEANGRKLSGITDIAVMPGAVERRRRFFTHTRYWKSRGPLPDPAPEHVRVLREALRLGDE